MTYTGPTDRAHENYRPDLIEEAPRDWETLCADALDVVETVGELEQRHLGGTEQQRRYDLGYTRRQHATRGDLAALAFQVGRLARQVAEIGQRLAGDTETDDSLHEPERPDVRALVDAWRTMHNHEGDTTDRPQLEELYQNVADTIDSLSRYDYDEDA